MSDDRYLYDILCREAVDTGPSSPVRSVQTTLMPVIQSWAPSVLNDVRPSGSFAKGTANKSGTDIDLFISLRPTTEGTLKDIYRSLDERLQYEGYSTRQQDVSLNIRVGSVDVDLVPARQQATGSSDHSLFRRRGDTWIKTNVDAHITTVRAAGRTGETRLLKLWRDQHGLDFPSFYLELSVIRALGFVNPQATGKGTWTGNIVTVLEYLRDSFVDARMVDPANTNNVVSDDLTKTEKEAIRDTAAASLASSGWPEVIG